MMALLVCLSNLYWYIFRYGGIGRNGPPLDLELSSWWNTVNINLEWAASFGKPGDILLYLYRAGATSHTAAVASAVKGLSWHYGKKKKEKHGRPEDLSPEMKVECQIEIPVKFPIAMGNWEAHN